jgi:hypothetical protein
MAQHAGTHDTYRAQLLAEYSNTRKGWGPRVKTHMHQNSHDQQKEDKKITQVR